MKRFLPILILAALHTVYADDAERKQWEERLPLLSNGMTRAQVEQIFPTNNSNGQIMCAGGGAYTLFYALDDKTEIALSYDDTVRDEATASNRLLKVIELRNISVPNLVPDNGNNN